MSLGLNTPRGEPIIKYDARAGRMFRDNAEITPQFSAVFDFPKIEVGWIRFANNGPPDFRVVPASQPMPLQPTPDHKKGFRLRVKLARSIGGDVREFASVSQCVCQSIDELHTAYVNAPESRAGKLPVVRMTGSQAVVSSGPKGTSTNYKPLWLIAEWIDRPAELNAAPASAPAYAPPAAPPLTQAPGSHVQHAPYGSTPVPPPAPAPQPAPVAPPIEQPEF